MVLISIDGIVKTPEVKWVMFMDLLLFTGGGLIYFMTYAKNNGGLEKLLVCEEYRFPTTRADY